MENGNIDQGIHRLDQFQAKVEKYAPYEVDPAAVSDWEATVRWVIESVQEPR